MCHQKHFGLVRWRESGRRNNLSKGTDVESAGVRGEAEPVNCCPEGLASQAGPCCLYGNVGHTNRRVRVSTRGHEARGAGGPADRRKGRRMRWYRR